MINNQIYITSVAKAVINAKKTGKLNLKIVQIFNLFKYYIDFAESVKTLGITTFNEDIITLKKEIAKLQYKYPDIICNYKVVLPNDPLAINVTNNAPTVSDTVLNIGGVVTQQLKVSDFILNFADIDNDSYKSILILPSLSASGDFIYQGNIVINVITINVEGLSLSADIPNLVYTRNNTAVFGPIISNFRVSDNNINSLFSSTKTISISATGQDGINQPPLDIGDNTIFVTNQVTTILTLTMFTTNLTPPYNDPEGDLIDAIRIIDISNSNKGIFKLSGIAIVDNQIITREDISANNFTHEGPTQDAISSDVFQFQARDEGSQIWVD